jgi:signal transduction histidine kinase
MPIGKSAFIWTTTLLLAIGLASLVAIVGVTWWLVERSEVYAHDVLESRDVRAAAVAVRNALQNMETGQRGFLLTGEEAYLEPYAAGLDEMAAALPQLASLVGTYLPGENESLAELQAAIASKQAELAETIELSRAGNAAAALAIVAGDAGKAAMDRSRALLADIVGTADARLADNVASQRSNTQSLRWVVILGGAVILLVGGGSVWIAVKYTRELAEARSELEVLNTALEERVDERTQELLRANEEIQRFAYIVTHDLRAPLVNIMGFTSELDQTMKTVQAYVLADGAPLSEQQVRDARLAAEEDLPEAIGFIRSSTRKMDGLINAILKISRDGRRPLKPEPLALVDMLQATADSIHHQVAETGGAITVGGDPVEIVGDRLSMEQVFGNLLDNAVKYRAPDRPIEIGVTVRRLPGARIRVDVADNGRGIARHDHQRVFDLFRRSGTQDRPGEGIGLAHVRSLLRNVGGEISVASELGVGTTFTVTFPADVRTVVRSNTDEQ